jgi:sugar phosphate isomerase/epimerase
MKMGLMRGEIVPRAELRSLGFEAVQLFFNGGQEDDGDPTPEEIDATLKEGDTVLAAMTLHVDLVGPQGCVQGDVDRAVRCVEKTAALDGRFGDNEKPLLVWHPSGYPQDPADDGVVFDGLCDALTAVCAKAEQVGVNLAVEITRDGSIGSAETFLHVADRVKSKALKVCIDAANFVPDRTPLQRAVRMLGPHIAIAHGKDSSFDESGLAIHYGPTGSGKLDHASYVGYLQEFARAPYFVLEYYTSRDELLVARDIIVAALR